MSRIVSRRAGGLFAGSVVVLVVAMAAISVASLRSERHALAERAAASRTAQLRATAAAMDRWLGPLLAREAGRHHADYAAYRAPRRAFSPALERLPEGSVIEPSPLLGYSADTIVLHFEWSPESGPRSPQVPLGRERELALASGLSPEALRLAEQRLASVTSQLDLPALARSVREQAPALSLEQPSFGAQARCLSPDELRESPGGVGLVEDAGTASLGQLVPRWYGEDGLFFARDVRVGTGSYVQAIVVDWPALSKLLLADCAKDLPGALLVRGEDEHGVGLAALPAAIVADAPPPALPRWTPQATRLAVGWIAGLVALGAIGYALRTSVVHAERRARFAAAVSHELRTPLTTLRLYSEMLADGVITDPAARQEYLATIHAESARLASLVENVLLHARIERRSGALQRMTVGRLVESVTPLLRRRVDEAGRPLVIEVEIDPSAEVEVDREAVERVLFNLVDNACKHGAAEDGTLRLEVRRRGSHVDLQVSDLGPGIPRDLGNAVFEAFRRGDESGAPGVGLGLALSRSLARELRGELSLVPSDRGACFRLSLRVA